MGFEEGDAAIAFGDDEKDRQGGITFIIDSQTSTGPEQFEHSQTVEKTSLDRYVPCSPTGIGLEIGAENHLPYLRMNAVGADQQVKLAARSIGDIYRDALVILDNAGDRVPGLDFVRIEF